MAVILQIPVSENPTENPRKRRKFASPWDVPPTQFKNCNESPSKRRRKLSSSWDVPPLLLQFHCDFFLSGVAQHDVQSAFTSTCSIPESQKAPEKQNEQRCSRDVLPPLRADDKDGHYTFQIGDNLMPRYRIVGKMGEGTFGQVVDCWDRKKEDNVAIKIVRGQPKYKEEAMIEIEMNQKISKSRRSKSRCVQMRDWFEYRNHICIVFEKLGSSLYDCLKKNDYHPFPIDVVRDIGRQLLESVAYMHDLNLVHTDLKPENILFVSSNMEKVQSKESKEFYKLPSSTAIKLIDFGSTELDDKYHTSVVSTRHYRAPEVILGLGWNCCCDIWSVGCILAELATGDTLFQTHKNLEHLAMMERILGPLPHHMIQKTQRQKYIYHGKRLNWPEGALSSESINTVKKLSKLKDIICKDVSHHYVADLIDLLYGLLEFEPSKRLTAAEALRQPIFPIFKKIVSMYVRKSLTIQEYGDHSCQQGFQGEQILVAVVNKRLWFQRSH